MLIKVGDEEVTQEYLDRYPYSDEAMYLRFKQEPKGHDPAHEHFVKWFENGKNPPQDLGRWRLIKLVSVMKRQGVTEDEFVGATQQVSEYGRRRLWRLGELPLSHETSERIIEDIQHLIKEENHEDDQ